MTSSRLPLKLVAIAIGIVAGLAVAEGAARVQEWAVHATSQSRGELYEHDAELGWHLQPNATQVQRDPDFEATYHVDGAGRRRSYPCPTGAAKPTLWVFGDSFTFGVGVEDQQTFAAIMARALDVCVQNLGVSGYDPGQYYMSYRRIAGDVAPDDVIIWGIYTGNDFADLLAPVPAGATRRKPYWVSSPAVVVQGVPVPVVAPAHDSGFHSAFLALVGESLHSSVLVRATATRLGMVPGPDKAALNRSLTVFGYLAERMPRGRTVFVLIPSISLVERHVAGSREDVTYREALNLLKRQHYAVVDLLGALAGTEGLYFPHEGHWNDRGHAAAARAMQPVVAQLLEARR